MHTSLKPSGVTFCPYTSATSTIYDLGNLLACLKVINTVINKKSIAQLNTIIYSKFFAEVKI